jgi:hypothetical protein
MALGVVYYFVAGRATSEVPSAAASEIPSAARNPFDPKELPAEKREP